LAGGVHWMIDPKPGVTTSLPLDSATAIRRYLVTSFTGSTATGVTKVRLGGRDGQTFDYSLHAAQAIPYLAIEEDEFRLGPGEKARFLVVPRGGHVIVLVLDAFAEEDFDALVALVQPILGSLRWV
jgi:hypothetical protein